MGEASSALTDESAGKTGNDTDHNDQGDTIANALIRNLLTQPHDEQGACGEQDDRRNPEEHTRVGHVRIERSHSLIGKLIDDIADITRSLDDDDTHGEVTHDLVQLLTTALAFTLQTLEVRDDHTQQLDDDGRGDVRHDTKGEDGGVTESAA